MVVFATRTGTTVALNTAFYIYACAVNMILPLWRSDTLKTDPRGFWTVHRILG